MRRRIFESVNIVTETQILSHEEHEFLQRSVQRNFEQYRELVSDLEGYQWRHVQVFNLPAQHYVVTALCNQQDAGSFYDEDARTWVRNMPWAGQWLHSASWQVWVTVPDDALAGAEKVIDDVMMGMLVGGKFRAGMREEIAQEILARLRQRGWDLVPLKRRTVTE
jgi:hypothetical protein